MRYHTKKFHDVDKSEKIQLWLALGYCTVTTIENRETA